VNILAAVPRWATAAIIGFLACVGASAGAHADGTEHLTIEDYFTLKQFTDLRLSDDGQWLAFATQSAAGTFGNAKRQMYAVATRRGAPQPIEIPDDASQLTWVPGAHRIAYLSKQAGTSQVFIYDIVGKGAEQVTHAASGVLSFAFRPRSADLAVVVSSGDPANELTDQLKSATSGILLDSDTASAYDFILGARGGIWHEQRGSLWLQDAAGQLSEIQVSGSVKSVNWSRDGAALSVVYVHDDVTPRMTQRTPTSIGIFDLERRAFFEVAVGAERRGTQEPVAYMGGEWLADGRRIVLRKNVGDRPWLDLCFVEWAIVAVAPRSRAVQAREWRAAESCDADAPIHLTRQSTLLVANTERGSKSLYEWSARRSRRATRLATSRGSQSEFAFSADLAQLAFVQQSMSTPPEIYFQDGEAGPIRRLTSVNDALARRALPRTRLVEWKSTDGTWVNGWLMEPATPRNGTRPLITYVHGGPGAVVVDEFAQFFGVWPYPFELYAADGMAVFFPNYRGTASYGREFMAPSGVDREPVDDVLSGVKFLVDSGLADERKLGLCGHSHGAWLGALIVTRTNMFAASSFAEGWANMLVTYDLMPGLLNRDVNDVVLGADPYTRPERYVQLSPGLHLQSVSTPVLFESGARSGALLNLAFAKAAKRFGVPSESIIYPNTDHVMSEPSLQREAASRNLQWFRFWLDESAVAGEAVDPVLRERWQRMRTPGAVSQRLR
jgi:dipeptidyl aminopeptidase/acylaminoacyl peptidase